MSFVIAFVRLDNVLINGGALAAALAYACLSPSCESDALSDGRFCTRDVCRIHGDVEEQAYPFCAPDHG